MDLFSEKNNIGEKQLAELFKAQKENEKEGSN